jgi:hypothetical protein
MAFIDYTDHGDGSFSFHDEMGTTTPPMAGPAAVQQKNKIDALAGTMGPYGPPGRDVLPPPTAPIRGERAELSPELLEAGGAVPDDRTAGVISTPTLAPHRSLVDIGGARPEVPESMSDVGAPLQAYNEEREKKGLPPVQPILPERKPEAPKKEAAMADEIVPEADRVQLSMPGQQGLRFAPAAPAGGGSAPKLQEVKAGETFAYADIPDEQKANIKRADQNRYLAAEQLGNAQAQAGANMTGVMAEIPQGLTELERERQLKEDTIAQRIQQDHERLDALRQETKRDVDPNAFWRNKSAAEKFMGALAMGIGAYVQTMRGGPNNAMQIIDGAIKDEIAAQNSNRQAAHQRFQDMRGQMSERRQLFADERQNFLAKKSAYLEQAQSKLATYMQDAKTEEQKAQIADLQARIQRESEMTMAEFGKVSHQVQTKVIQTGGAKPAGSGMSELDHEKYVPQFGGLAPTKEEAVLARQKGADLETMRRLVAENVRLREHPEAFIKGTDKNAELRSNHAKMILILKRKGNEDLGVIAGPDMDLMIAEIGDGSSVVPGQTAAMKNFLSNENRVNENVRRNIGLIPVQTAPIRDDKTGEIRIGQQVTGNIVTPNNVTGRYDQPVQTVHIAKTSRQEKK